MVKSYREKRLAQGVTARTVNKETVAFYQVLKLANDRGLISSLPRVRQLKQKPPPKRPLLAPEDVERLLRHCELGRDEERRFAALLPSLSGPHRSERKGSSSHPLGGRGFREALCDYRRRRGHQERTAPDREFHARASVPSSRYERRPPAGFLVSVPLPSAWPEGHSRPQTA